MRMQAAESLPFGKSCSIRWLKKIMMLIPAFCLLYGTALADTLWTPSMVFMATHDDNILFSRTDTVDDYVYIAQPQLKLDYNQELTHIAANGRVIIRRYQDNDDLNDELYKFNFDGKTNFTERFRMRGDYEFIKDTTLDSELLEVGRISSREDRSSHDIRLAPSFNLTERTSIGIDGRYRYVTYDSDTFVDYTMWHVGLPVSFRLETQIDTIYFSPGYTDRDSDTTQSKTYNLRLGWRHETTERLNMDLSIGVRHTELEQLDTGDIDKSWNGIADLRMKYEFETGNLSMDFRHNLLNTADGSQINVSKLIATLRWNFVERVGMELNGRFYYTQTEGESRDDDSQFMQAGVALFYNLTENHNIFIAYEYSQDEPDDSQNEPRAEKNLIWAGIKLRFPIN